MIKIVKDDDFEGKKERFYKRVKEDVESARVVKGLMFPVGKILTLEIEVTDEYLSQSLYALLHDYSTIEGKENLGFTVREISFRPTNRDNIVRELETLAVKIKQGEI